MNEIADFFIEQAYENINFSHWANSLERKILSKFEREKIFLEDKSVTIGEAHEFKRLYLENKLKENADRYFAIQEHNNKYPEFILDLPNLTKAQKDYDWHIKLTPKENIDIDQIKQTRKIGEFVTLGRNGFVNCPIHNEKTPSFKSNKEETLWHCFGCGEGGSVIDLIMKLQNLSFIEAIKFLA